MTPQLVNFERESFMSSFAVKLRAAREALGLSQTELAREIRVSVAALQKWEAGSHMPGTLAYRRATKVFKRAAEEKKSGKKVCAR